MHSHLVLPNLILEIADIKKAYPHRPQKAGDPHKEFTTCVELASSSGVVDIDMPFEEFKKRFEKALGVEDVKNN